MKKCISFLISIVSILLFLVSCSNFMNSSDLKAQIEKEIYLANADKSVVRLSLSKSEHGKITPQDDITMIVGIPTEIEFKINSLYSFDGWSVTDKETKLPVNDAISFGETLINQDGSQLSYSVSITLTRKISNLILKPVCHIKNDITSPELFGEIKVTGTAENLNNNILFNDYNYEVTKNDRDSNNKHINKANKVLINCSIKEEDSSSVSALIYEYPIEKYSDGSSTPKFSLNPFITEVEGFVQSGEGLFSTKTNNGDYITYEFRTDVKKMVKIAIYFKDGAGNTTKEPVIYYISKDTDTESLNIADYPFELTLSDLSDVHNLSEKEILKKFNTYRVFYKTSAMEADADSVDESDMITYSYEVSEDGINYSPVSITPHKDLEIYSSDYCGDISVIYADLDISSFNRTNGIYIKAIGHDECENTKENTKFFPYSTEYYSGTVTSDKSKIYPVHYNNPNFSGSYSSFLIYSTDRISWNICDGTINDYNHNAETLYLYTITYSNENNPLYKLSVLSNLYELAISNFSVSDVILDSINLSNININNSITISASATLKQNGKNTGTSKLVINTSTSDPQQRIKTWAGTIYYNENTSSDMVYSVGGTFIFPNVYTNLFNECTIFIMGLDANGCILSLDYFTNTNSLVSAGLEAAGATRHPLFDFTLIDNKKPEITDFTLNHPGTSLSFKINESSLGQNSKLEPKIYYSPINKQRTPDEIKKLNQIPVTSYIPYGETEYIYSGDISFLEKTTYQFYIYAEDKSPLNNYVYDERIVNTKRLNYNNYCKVQNSFSVISASPEYRKVYVFDSSDSNDFINSDWTPCSSNPYDAYNSFSFDDSIHKPQVTSTVDYGYHFYRVIFTDGVTLSYPYYYYGADVECNAKNLLCSDSVYTIVMDQPCYAHVVYNKLNYGDQPQEWEVHTPESQKIAKKVYSPVTPGNTSMVNTVTSYDSINGRVNLLDTIPEDYYYCTIVYFTDGDCMMSPIRKK